jgi:hypothetical protein
MNLQNQIIGKQVVVHVQAKRPFRIGDMVYQHEIEENKTMRAFWIAAIKMNEEGKATEIMMQPKLILAKDQRAAELITVQMLGSVDLDYVEVSAVPFG